MDYKNWNSSVILLYPVTPESFGKKKQTTVTVQGDLPNMTLLLLSWGRVLLQSIFAKLISIPEFGFHQYVTLSSSPQPKLCVLEVFQKVLKQYQGE